MIAARQPKAETEEVASDKSGPRRMLNEKQVLEIVPISRTTLYRLERAGKFPKSVYLSPNRKAWFLDTIVAWQTTINECDPHFNPNRGRGKGRRA